MTVSQDFSSACNVACKSALAEGLRAVRFVLQGCSGIQAGVEA